MYNDAPFLREQLGMEHNYTGAYQLVLFHLPTFLVDFLLLKSSSTLIRSFNWRWEHSGRRLFYHLLL